MSETTKKKSSTTIGCVWYKVSEGGNEYYPVSINDELLPLTITDKHSIVLFPIADEDRKSDNSPNFRIVLSKKEVKNVEVD